MHDAALVAVVTFFVTCCFDCLCFYQKKGLNACIQDSKTISNNKDTLIIVQLVSCVVLTYSMLFSRN